MEKEQLCCNCGKSVSPSVYDLHIAHCERFIFQCICGDTVSIKDSEAHMALKHKSTECVYCQAKMDAWELNTHSCPHNFFQCPFCECIFSEFESTDHEDLCSIRTEQCHKCLAYVMRKDLKEHLENECMPSLSDFGVPKKNQPSPSKRKKSNQWQTVENFKVEKPKSRHAFGKEDFDRLYAEELMEEMIYEDMEVEIEDYDVYNRPKKIRSNKKKPKAVQILDENEIDRRIR
ncbi:unnamed protein product [Blepharisma stoltei]|uniref:TRAF-type domain-containing protein n=1 Tax=Blepharisma stoltei TaxID=1481888 RepID=A0AAU9JZV5_9CILI|nr:unnamed protein product [Blepharisma stoltei]